MAGHVEDRWWRDKKDESGKPVLNAKGKPEREKTPLYGKGMRYRVRYYIGRQEKSESFPDKKLERAKAFLLKVQTDVLTGTYVDPDAGKVTFKAYTENWRKGQSTDASTVQTITTRLNGMVWPFFGEITLDRVTTDKIRDWLDWMAQPRKGKTFAASYRSVVFDLVSAILSGAVEDKKILSNPCKATSIKKPKPEQRKIIPWTATKLFAVQLALPDRYQIVTHLGAGLALRQMEIFGFSPDDIARDDMKAKIRRQIRWIGPTPVFAPPKGGKTREVPIGAGVLGALDNYLQAYEPVSVTLPWLAPGGKPVTARLLIDKEREPNRRFSTEWTATIWRGYNFNNDVWHPAIEAAGPSKSGDDGMHAMRHFCASNWLAQGVSIKEVSEFLGHHDPGYTLKIYTHLVPSSYTRVRAASDHIFKPDAPPATSA
jgi:integrase